MSHYDDLREDDSKPDDDIPDGVIPAIGDQSVMGRVPYWPHSEHTIQCTDVYHLQGREYQITWTCVTCADGETWNVSRRKAPGQ